MSLHPTLRLKLCPPPPDDRCIHLTRDRTRDEAHLVLFASWSSYPSARRIRSNRVLDRDDAHEGSHPSIRAAHHDDDDDDDDDVEEEEEETEAGTQRTVPRWNRTDRAVPCEVDPSSSGSAIPLSPGPESPFSPEIGPSFMPYGIVDETDLGIDRPFASCRLITIYHHGRPGRTGTRHLDRGPSR